MNKKILYIAVIVMFVIAGYILWSRSDSIRLSDSMNRQTPQETLKSFVTALESGDITKAADHFSTSSNIKPSDWEQTFGILIERDLLDDMINDIKMKAEPDLENSNNVTFRFNIKEDGSVVGVITLVYNENLKIWEIESL